MGLDPAMRFGLFFGIVAGLSWYLLAEDGLASPMQSATVAIVALILAYSVGSLVRKRLGE
jgi:hypothetical protein